MLSILAEPKLAQSERVVYMLAGRPFYLQQMQQLQKNTACNVM